MATEKTPSEQMLAHVNDVLRQRCHYAATAKLAGMQGELISILPPNGLRSYLHVWRSHPIEWGGVSQISDDRAREIVEAYEAWMKAGQPLQGEGSAASKVILESKDDIQRQIDAGTLKPPYGYAERNLGGAAIGTGGGDFSGADRYAAHGKALADGVSAMKAAAGLRPDDELSPAQERVLRVEAHRAKRQDAQKRADFIRQYMLQLASQPASVDIKKHMKEAAEVWDTTQAEIDAAVKS